jgi:hypothetical protein
MPYGYLRGYVIAVLGFRIFSVLQTQLPLHLSKVITRSLLVVVNCFVLVFFSGETPIIFIILWGLLTLTFLVWAFHQSTIPQQFPETQKSASWNVNQGIADWLYQKIEVKFLSEGVTKTAGWFTQVSGWVYRHVESGFERLWIKVGDSLMAISLTTLQSEEKGQRRVNQSLRSWVDSLQRFEARHKKTAAHWDLIWIPFILIFILIFLFLT